MRNALLLALLLAALPLAGCLGASPKDGDAGPAGTSGSHSSTGTATPRPRPVVHVNGTNSTPNATAGGGSANVSGPPREWAPLGSATIRPGVQMVADGSQCTSNFLFTSPDNLTVYLGFAAHCVTNGDPNAAADGCDPVADPMDLGTKVDVQGADHKAVLVYTSWGTMQAQNEGDPDLCNYNDFALVRLDPEDAAKANPAMLFFGGPTALASPDDVAMFDKVLTYGDSGLRQGLAALSPHEGYVVFPPSNGGWTSEVYTLPQGIPGDSGSGVILGDGPALGILVTISYAGGSNGVTTLAKALEYAAETGGLDARLATADLLDSGTLPPV